MKIIILGSNGLVGSEVCKYLSKHHEIVKSDIDTLDLSDIKLTELFFKKICASFIAEFIFIKL